MWKGPLERVLPVRENLVWTDPKFQEFCDAAEAKAGYFKTLSNYAEFCNVNHINEFSRNFPKNLV